MKKLFTTIWEWLVGPKALSYDIYPQHSGTWHNPSLPEELIDLRYITDFKDETDYLLVNARLLVGNDFKWLTALYPIKHSKQHEITLETEGKEGLVGWGTMYLTPKSLASLSITIVSSQTHRPEALFKKL